jgi:hypothetical protein
MPNPAVALASGNPTAATTRGTTLPFKALAKKDLWILSQRLLEEQGCTAFSSLGEERTCVGYQGEACQCVRPPR